MLRIPQFKKRQERSRLSNYELECLDYEQRKQERDRKTLEEGLDASRVSDSQIILYIIFRQWLESQHRHPKKVAKEPAILY